MRASKLGRELDVEPEVEVECVAELKRDVQ